MAGIVIFSAVPSPYYSDSNPQIQASIYQIKTK